ncbi:hypothetical protein B7494_g4573 [Chlorociboria aeruginascens]|nr:hypothetical protein B7494_g4573 [Chlorociboria aeruginascens]
MFAAWAFVGVVLLSQASAQCWRDTACTGPAESSFPGTWESNIYSPLTRVVSPIKVLNADNSVNSSYGSEVHLINNGSLLIFDFGQEVGGIATITYSANAQGTGAMGIAFSEAQNWTGTWSDDSNGSYKPDGALYANITATGVTDYTMPDDKMRGGFRYLSLFTTTDGTIDVTIYNITLELSFQPAWSNLRAYGGYFQSSDELLNRIWYAGAYTLQTNNIPSTTGRAWPIISSGWENTGNLGTTGTNAYVDGAKRDRTIWTGDLGVAISSILVSTGDAEGVKNTLESVYNDQGSTGELPFDGAPIIGYGSDTYHMSTLIGTYDYILYTGDTDYLTSIWTRYQLGMSFITAKIDSTGMLDVTGTADWGRYTQGGHNTEANMLMYRTLITGSSMATWANDTDLASTLATQAVTLKTAVNANNYDSSVGAFKDSDTDDSVHPEDGNSMALAFDGANASYFNAISEQLTTNWGPIGAVCPELSGNIVGFVQSFEVKGHLAVGQATRALKLMRLSWGWYLNSPYGTGSTALEGYLSDGSFGYRADAGYQGDYAYTSHSHGWSTGPTAALSNYIVGLQLTSPGGQTWTLAPQLGDLTSAEGGFTTPLGRFYASWALVDGGYNLSYSAPDGTTGTLNLPGQSSGSKVKRNGEHVAGFFDKLRRVVSLQGDGGTHELSVHF